MPLVPRSPAELVRPFSGDLRFARRFVVRGFVDGPHALPDAEIGGGGGIIADGNAGPPPVRTLAAFAGCRGPHRGLPSSGLRRRSGAGRWPGLNRWRRSGPGLCFRFDRRRIGKRSLRRYVRQIRKLHGVFGRRRQLALFHEMRERLGGRAGQFLGSRFAKRPELACEVPDAQYEHAHDQRLDRDHRHVPE